MNKKITTIASSLVAFLVLCPLLAQAQVVLPGGTPGTIKNGDIRVAIIAVLNFIWPLFIGFAILAFLIAGFLFLSANGDSGKVRDARNAVIWGVVGVIVGILAFSIPLIVGNTLGTGIGFVAPLYL